MSNIINWTKFLPKRICHRLSYEINHFLPESVYRAVKRFRHEQYKKKFHKQITKMTNSIPVNVDEGPAQSTEVALATSVMSEKGVKNATDADLYFGGTYKTMRRFLKELEEINFDFNKMRTVLDFGCGSAKFARILRCVPGVHLIGTDMNIHCVKWCRKNIPGVEFYANKEQPPLSFAEDNSIDLIIAYSVFTHIRLEIQESWLQELRRTMRRGGCFLCTVLGDFHAFKMLSDQEQKQLNKEGHFSLKPNSKRISLASKVTEQDDVFQTRAELFKIFGEYFEILRYKKMEPQNLLVLRKPLLT